MKITPGHREHLTKALKEHGPVAVATGPGLRRFDIYPDTNDSNQVWSYGGQVDQEAFDTHLRGASHLQQRSNFGGSHRMEEWPPTKSTGMAHSIWTSEKGDQ